MRRRTIFTALVAAALLLSVGVQLPATEREKSAPLETGAEAEDPAGEPRPSGPAMERTVRAPAVAWRTWSMHMLEVAEKLDRPIFLYLTNPWNTMGRIMDANTFSDPRVWATLRDLYIPVRVDVDRRPDIKERFNAGALPSIAIVMPSGESLYLKSPKGSYIRAAGSVLPAGELYNYLRSVADYYRDNRSILDLKIEDIVRRFKRDQNLFSAPLDYAVVRTVANALRERFDRTYSGFGLDPKVPDAQTLLFCWQLVRLQGDPQARDLGLRTLRAIWDSPLHDEVEGGVFRIAMERDWTKPRYEKVLDVNARLLEAMAEGLLVTGERWLERAVREQANFLIERFAHPQGGFMRAQGSGDAFGSYFQLSRRKRRKVEPPPIFPLRIVSWNAHAATALLRAYQAAGEERYRDEALGILEFLLGTSKAGSRGMAHYFDERAQMVGLLTDQVSTARALLDAYQVTGNPLYLLEASSLVTAVRTFYRDETTPTFVDRFQDPRLRGAMRRPDRDLIENAEFALVMLDLSALTGNDVLVGEAQQTLEMFADQVDSYGTYAAPLARAVNHALRRPVRLVVRKGGQHEQALALARQAARMRHRWVVVDWFDARASVVRVDPDERALLEQSEGAAALLVDGRERIGPLSSAEDIQQVAGAWLPRTPSAASGASFHAGVEKPRAERPTPQTRPARSRP